MKPMRTQWYYRQVAKLYGLLARSLSSLCWEGRKRERPETLFAGNGQKISPANRVWPGFFPPREIETPNPDPRTKSYDPRTKSYDPSTKFLNPLKTPFKSQARSISVFVATICCPRSRFCFTSALLLLLLLAIGILRV